MTREKLVSIIVRLHFCNTNKLEDFDTWNNMRNYLLNLNETEFYEKAGEYGLLEKVAS